MTGFRFSRSNVQYPARKLGQFSSAVQYIYCTAALFSTQDTVHGSELWSQLKHAERFPRLQAFSMLLGVK